MELKELLEHPDLTVTIIDCSEVNGQYIKDFREKYNLTQIALANILHVKRNTIVKWENGKSKISGSSALLLILLMEDKELFNKVYKVDKRC